MDTVHCGNNQADRALGAFWEKAFCQLAGLHDLVFTPMQIGRIGAAIAYARGSETYNRFLLPDVVIWTCPGEHHEIKHKEPTSYGRFGLEEYRLQALVNFARLTGQDVMYTIHNHALSGGRDATVNDIAHWITANVLALDGHYNHRQNNGESYVNGVGKTVPILYWDSAFWIPLDKYWQTRVKSLSVALARTAGILDA